jgi:hypothetical protein
VFRVLSVRGQKLLNQNKAGGPARELGKQGSTEVPLLMPIFLLRPQAELTR